MKLKRDLGNKLWNYLSKGAKIKGFRSKTYIHISDPAFQYGTGTTIGYRIKLIANDCLKNHIEAGTE